MRRLLLACALLTAATLLTTSVAVAQADPSASPSAAHVGSESATPAPEPAPYKELCEVFGPAAVAAALGERLREAKALTTKRMCRYSPRSKRSFTELTVTTDELDQETYVFGEETVDTVYELLKLNYPEVTETEVAGLPALRQPVQRLIREARGWTWGTLYVVPDRTRWLYLTAYAPRGVDVDEALRTLAELALPRLYPGVASAPTPTASASPSAAPGSSLAAGSATAAATAAPSGAP